jgi:hypothetical protein
MAIDCAKITVTDFLKVINTKLANKLTGSKYDEDTLLGKKPVSIYHLVCNCIEDILPKPIDYVLRPFPHSSQDWLNGIHIFYSKDYSGYLLSIFRSKILTNEDSNLRYKKGIIKSIAFHPVTFYESTQTIYNKEKIKIPKVKDTTILQDFIYTVLHTEFSYELKKVDAQMNIAKHKWQKIKDEHTQISSFLYTLDSNYNIPKK